MSAPSLRSHSRSRGAKGSLDAGDVGGSSSSSGGGPSSPPSRPSSSSSSSSSTRSSTGHAGVPSTGQWINRCLVPGIISMCLRWLYLTIKAVSAAMSSSGAHDGPLLLRWLVHPLALVLSVLSPRKAPRGLPHVDVMEKLGDNAVRVLGLNPGPYTLQGTNTYLIGSGEVKILVDTGEAETSSQYCHQLFDFVFPVTRTTGLSHIVLTHGHHDHQGGVERILDECARRGLPVPAVLKHSPARGDAFPCLVRGAKLQELNDGDEVRTEGATLRVVATPGHTSDHVSLIILESGVVITGDCVLGCGSTVFEDLREYMTSLKRLRALMAASHHNLRSAPAPPSHDHTSDSTEHKHQSSIDSSATPPPPPHNMTIDAIYPGHGPVIPTGGLAKVEEYIRHREQRDRQILDFLERLAREGGDGVWASSWNVMCAVYADSLKVMPLTIRLAAQNSAVHHLEKLVTERRVTFCWPDMYRVELPDK